MATQTQTMTDLGFMFCEPCYHTVKAVICAECNQEECENCNSAYGCEENGF